MEYISSDTNIWLDFQAINAIELPFKLHYKYIIFEETLRSEIIDPQGLIDELLSLGLQPIDITAEELFYADELASKYNGPSTYDRIALAIAKKRGITLLTGDGALRKAAEKEGVNVMGSIGVLDELYNYKKIDKNEYRSCLEQFQKDSSRRLPIKEIEKRLNELKVKK